MKTFEEKWTAWIDGELSEVERAEFEASLDEPRSAAAEKEQTLKLRALLKEQLQPRAMGNEEFFHHQLRSRIEQEIEQPSPTLRPQGRETWWTIPRLLWAGATSLAVFAVCTVFVMREKQTAGQSQYLTQILNARVDPGEGQYATVSIFETQEDRVTVLWVDGLQSLPADYAAR